MSKVTNLLELQTHCGRHAALRTGVISRFVFLPLSSWEGRSLKGKQELVRKTGVLLAGGRLGCHGNCRVRSSGCCSASVGTHYATSHLSISICLCSSVAFTPALCAAPRFLPFPLQLWSISVGGGVDGGIDK